MRSKKYIADYEIVYDEKGKKRLVYNGTLYRLDLPEEQFRQVRLAILAYEAVFVAAFIINGFIGGDGLRQFYIGLPYTLSLLPVSYIAADAVRFMFFGKGGMERIRYEGSFLRMYRSSWGLIYLHAFMAAGSMLYWLLSGGSFVLMKAQLTFFFVSSSSLYAAIRFKNRLKKLRVCIKVQPPNHKNGDNNELTEKP